MKSVKFDSDRLILSISYSMLVEWLRRNGHYLKFMANVSAQNSFCFTPQECVRSYVSTVLHHRSLTLGNVIDTAFAFDLTPEGVDYWRRVSAYWSDFVEEFSAHF